MRDKVKDELQLCKQGDLVEVKFIDACRVNNVVKTKIADNQTFATYKRIVGEYYATFYDQMYREPFFVIVVEITNDKFDVVSIPERNIQRIHRLRRDRKLKKVSGIGQGMLIGSVNNKFFVDREGVGEVTNK